MGSILGRQGGDLYVTDFLKPIKERDF